MPKFIKLTNFVLNTNDIHKIIITPNKYHIQVATKKLDGFTWKIFGFGLGFIHSQTFEIEVCEMNHSSDYKSVSEWINKI